MNTAWALAILLVAGCGGDDDGACRCRVGSLQVDLACGASQCVDGVGYLCASKNQLTLDEAACAMPAPPDMARPARDLDEEPCLLQTCSELGIACGTATDRCGDLINCGDCAGGLLCTANRCVEPCTDGVKNAGESDVDCGGARCGGCAVGKACASSTDCAAGASCDRMVCRAGTYTKLAALPNPRSDAAVAVADGKIYLVGGVASGTVSNKVEVYSPAAGSWAALTSLGTARAELGAAFGAGGKLYAVGGRGDKTAEVYDPVSKMWSAIPSLSRARRGGRLGWDAAAGGKLVMLGGYDRVTESCGAGCSSAKDLALDTAETFTVGETEWKAASLTMLGARHGFGLLPLAAGGWLLAGGSYFVDNPSYSPMCTGFCSPKQLATGVATTERCDLMNGCSSASLLQKVAVTTVGAWWMAGVELAGEVFVFGEEEDRALFGYPVAWRVTGGSMSRIAAADLGWLNGAAVVDGKIYLVGSRDIYLFTP